MLMIFLLFYKNFFWNNLLWTYDALVKFIKYIFKQIGE